MSKKRHVMVDLETFGTFPGCVIAQIGAVSFDPEDPNTPMDEFLANVDVDSSHDIGLRVNDGTLRWWLKQPEEARKSLETPEPIRVKDALRLLGDFIGKHGHIWCHATFDAPVLTVAYAMAKIKQPWPYREVTDLRTFFRDRGFNPRAYDRDPSHVHHSAIGDCKHQIALVRAAIAADRGRATFSETLEAEDREMDDATLWNLALEAASKSRCRVRKVGAALATPRGAVFGWNCEVGEPHDCSKVFDAGCAEDPEMRKVHKTWSGLYEVHAEIECLATAAKCEAFGETMAVTYPPCTECAKALVAFGVKRLLTTVEKDPSRAHKNYGIDMLQSLGVEVIKMEV